MRMALLFLSTFLLLSFDYSHDAVIAVFKLSSQENKLMLDITFDIQDYIEHTGQSNESLESTDFHTYLTRHTAWKINEKEADIHVVEIKKDGDHFRVSCQLQNVPFDVRSLKITNEFFLHVPSHSNIIMVDLHDSFRDFRMHAGRREIEVVY